MSCSMMVKVKSITVRLDDELLKRVQHATDRRRDPYAPNLTQLVERGLELALQEMAKRGRNK